MINLKNLCFCSLEGQVITPKNPEYEIVRQEWNRAIQKLPIALVYCSNNHEVIQAILWGKENNVPIRIRSGGHNYEGYSTGNCVLVIDISKMNNIKIDSSENTVKVQGGVKNSQLYNYISSQGYPFPGGLCPTVGVSGYTLGGGWGYSCRKFGLGCDSLVEIEIINYNGCILRANQRENSELFWALKGAGGGNFGVVVSMTYKLPSKVDKVTIFELYYPNASKDIQVQFLQIWQRWITTVDNDINMSGGVYNSEDDGIYVYVRGISYKNEIDTEKLLAPFLNIENIESSFEELTFLEAINKLGSTYPPYEYFKSTGRFAQRVYTEEELNTLLDIVNKPRPQGSYLTQIGIYGLGGAVSNISQSETAYYYRDAWYILSIQSVFENNAYRKINNKWVDDNFKYIYSITEGSYVNFPYSELKDYLHDYYGCNVNKLKLVKKYYDPKNVFGFPQGIK